jgi:general secretion pathway protein D
MIGHSKLRVGLVWITLTALLCAQPAQPPAQPPKPTTTTPAAAPPAAAAGTIGGLNFYNASLVDVIDILARNLKINYILDPKVTGKVILNTYGEIKPVDVRQLLDTILRMNGAVMVQVGDLYRIVPAADAVHLPISPKLAVPTQDATQELRVEPNNAGRGTPLPPEEQVVLNLIFLKYVSVTDMKALIDPFLGEGRTMVVYDPANLMIIQDNARNMRRTMELIALFDNDAFASKRVRLFEVEHGRPSDMAKELETVFKAFALSEKNSAVKFMPIDRINTIIAVAPNPGSFEEVARWIAKLDVAQKVTAGSVENYLYRLRYGCAETVAGAVMRLYGAFSPYGGGYGGYGGNYGGYGGPGNGSGCAATLGGGLSGGIYGASSFGGGNYMGGYGGGNYGGYGGNYGGGYGAYPQGAYGYPQGGYPPQAAYANAQRAPVAPTAPGAPGAATDLTGSYLGAAGSVPAPVLPRIIPNPYDNTILVQGTPQEWQQIEKLLEQIDIPPRQVLIEAKIYSVELSGAFQAGVNTAFQAASGRAGESNAFFPSMAATAVGTTGPGGLALTAAALVGRHRELLSFLTLQENSSKAKVIAEPSVIATDSIEASINVGQTVPTLSSQGISAGIQLGGNSVFTNTVANVSTGTTLSILARVNPSGIVTMVINQQVSDPQQPSSSSAIQSPSFAQKAVSTQVTVQDGDTIAIGGIIQESTTESSSGIPVLHKLPVVGPLFGNKTTSKDRTELVIFLTPHVIYDTNQVQEATHELQNQMKKLKKMYRE